MVFEPQSENSGVVEVFIPCNVGSPEKGTPPDSPFRAQEVFMWSKSKHAVHMTVFMDEIDKHDLKLFLSDKFGWVEKLYVGESKNRRDNQKFVNVAFGSAGAKRQCMKGGWRY